MPKFPLKVHDVSLAHRKCSYQPATPSIVLTVPFAAVGSFLPLYSVHIFYNCLSHQPTCLRPFIFLRKIIFRPVRLRMRYRNPWRRFCTSLVCPFIVFLGPQRICMPENPGCAEIAPLATRSKVVAPTTSLVGAVVGVNMEGRRDVGRRRGEAVRDGRIGVDIVVNDLLYTISKNTKVFRGKQSTTNLIGSVVRSRAGLTTRVSDCISEQN